MLAAPQFRQTARHQPPPPATDQRRVQRAAQPSAAWQRIATAVPVSRAGDAAEQEADRVADALVRGESAQVGCRASTPGDGAGPGPAVQRRCAACADEERAEEDGRGQVQRKTQTAPGQDAPPGRGTPALPPAQPIASGGEPLSAGLREWLEPSLGADLGAVRLHTGAAAAESARRFQARAYTFGSHIVFGPDGLDPGRPADRRLLAHELVHTVQQSGGSGPSVQREPQKKPTGPFDDWDFDIQPIVPNPLEKPEDIPEPCRQVPGAPGCEPGGSLQLPGPGALAGICKTNPSLPLCGGGPSPTLDLCPSGFHRSTADRFKDQCCKNGTQEDPRVCCPRHRIGDERCCASDESALGGHCTKSGSILVPSLPCPQFWKAASGECCFPPKVPGQEGCTIPPPVAPPKPLLADTFVDRFTVLFREGRPREGQGLAESLAAGREALDQAIAALKQDFSLSALLEANASREGEPGHNLDLTDRRLALVRAEMKDVSLRIRDAMPPLADTDGCRGSWGAYSCGALHADPEGVLPHERNVVIRLFRPTELKPLWPFAPSVPRVPGQSWGGAAGPVVGPF